MTIDDLIDRRVPLALVAAVLMQGGCAVWWAATKDSDDRFQQQKIEHIERALGDSSQGTTQILERLSRIEERLNADGRVLDHIEKQMGRGR